MRVGTLNLLHRGRHAVTLSKVKKKTREWRTGLIVTAHKLLEE